jgi:hypothetical protein
MARLFRYIAALDRNYRRLNHPGRSERRHDLAKERFSKNLWTERTSGSKPRLLAVRDEADQARFGRVLDNRESGTLLNQHAILFRTSSHSGSLEVELTRRNAFETQQHWREAPRCFSIASASTLWADIANHGRKVRQVPLNEPASAGGAGGAVGRLRLPQ